MRYKVVKLNPAWSDEGYKYRVELSYKGYAHEYFTTSDKPLDGTICVLMMNSLLALYRYAGHATYNGIG